MKTWLITGVSSGFGRAIADAALAAGDRVVGTLRNDADRAAFADQTPGRSHGVILDVTQTATIVPTVERIEREVGPIDVAGEQRGIRP